MLCDRRFKFGFRLHWTKAIMAQPVAGLPILKTTTGGFFDRPEKTPYEYRQFLVRIRPTAHNPTVGLCGKLVFI
jgi:hypothetical protein